MASVAWVCISWQQDPDVVLKKQNCLLRNVSLPQQSINIIQLLPACGPCSVTALANSISPSVLLGTTAPPLLRLFHLKPQTLYFHFCVYVYVCVMYAYVCVCLFMYVSVGMCDTVCTCRSENNHRSQSLPSILFGTRSPCSLLSE